MIILLNPYKQISNPNEINVPHTCSKDSIGIIVIVLLQKQQFNFIEDLFYNCRRSLNSIGSAFLNIRWKIKHYIKKEIHRYYQWIDTPLPSKKKKKKSLITRFLQQNFTLTALIKISLKYFKLIYLTDTKHWKKTQTFQHMEQNRI